MDLATLIGMLGAFGVVTYSVIKTDQLPLFTEDLFSPIFVLSGTMLGVMIRFSLGHFFSSLKVVAKTFSNTNDDPQSLIDEIVQLATVSRKDGLLAKRPSLRLTVASWTISSMSDWGSSLVLEKVLATTFNELKKCPSEKRIITPSMVPDKTKMGEKRSSVNSGSWSVLITEYVTTPNAPSMPMSVAKST